MAGKSSEKSAWKKCQGGEAAGGPVPKKEHMTEDMQGALAQCIFSDPPCTQTIDRGPEPFCRTYSRPGYRLRTIWELELHFEKAALVCKTWNQKYKEHLAAVLVNVFESVCERAVDLALNMCDIDEYTDMPTLSRVVHSVYRGERCLFIMRFTRTGSSDGVRELLANYGIPASRVPTGTPRSPVRIIKLPEVCWIPMRDCQEKEIDEFRQWRAEQKRALEAWLGEQHGVFHKKTV